MKGLNINISSCASQNSTSILSSNMEAPSSSSPSSPSPSPSSSSFSTFTTGSRAIDRHNPIITDERRSGGGGGNSCASTPIRTPCTNNILQQKPTTPISVTINSPKSYPSTPKKKGSSKLASLTKKTTTSSKRNHAPKIPVSSPFNNYYYENTNDIIIDDDHHRHHHHSGRRSFSKPSDLITKAAACANTRPGVDYISPPESSRYLLDDTSFLEVLSDFDPVLKLVSYDSNENNNNNNNNNNGDDENRRVEGGDKFEPGSKPFKPSPSSESSDQQVVVLRVSLHCRGCERKMKKHLSRMPGVTSFNIDFAAKKVTVVGDVTPLGVLASISKVKTAKLWTAPAISSSSQLNSKNMHVIK